MKKRNIIYLSCAIATLLVVVTAFFFDRKHLLYVKPLALVSFIIIHTVYGKKYKLLYILSMLVLLVNDSLVHIDFAGYFDAITITITIYFLISAFLLRDYFVVKYFKLSKVFSFPVIASVVLVLYLVFSISDLVIPRLKDSMFFFVLVITSTLFFACVCFFVYISDSYSNGFRLFISGCCCLFVNALLPINELMFYNKVFTVLVNLAELAGVYFFTIFLIEAKLLSIGDEEDLYL